MRILNRRLAVLALGVAALAAPVQAEVFRAETTPPGGGGYLGMVGFANVVQKYTDHSIEVSAGKPATRSMVPLAKGGIDFGNVVYYAVDAMRAGTGPYKKLKGGDELADNYRLIFSHPGGAYHMITFADSGIETLHDIKGRKVFSGPAGSAQRQQGTSLIAGETGYEPGKDYELLDLDLRGGEQAFVDGHVDLYVRTAPLGGAMIEQIGVSRKMRILGLSEEGMGSEEIKRQASQVGRAALQIEPQTYTGQVNEEPVTTMGFWLAIGTHKDVDADVIYEMTKAFHQNLGEFKGTAKALFADISDETLFEYMNAPLHAGAYRYFKEIGLDIPARLTPPEIAQN